MHLKGFTPMAKQVFNVLESDIGRYLFDITHKLQYEDLSQDIEDVLTTLRPVEREVLDLQGRCYLFRVSPYRTNEDRIDGAVLNFIDITARRKTQEELQITSERLRLVAESTEDYAIITLDGGGVVTGWNAGAE